MTGTDTHIPAASGTEDINNTKKKFTNIEAWYSRKGRGGKPVYVIKGIKDTGRAEPLLKFLKQHLHCGGTRKDGEIIIQCTDKTKLSSALSAMCYTPKWCGG